MITARRRGGGTEPPQRVGTWAAYLLVFAAGLFAAPPGAAQQGMAGLAATCSGGTDGALADRCADAALAAGALTAGLGLLTSAGGAIPVSPSTAGHRLEGSPRFVLDVGANVASFRLPDLTSGQTAVDRRSSFLAGRLTVAAGLFEGFSPAAVVGGVGSVDGVATVRLLRLPSGRGFSGSAASLGGGVRLGLLRESFSLPGVTVSLLHHRVGTVRYGDLETGSARAVLQPRVTSARLEIGKDMLAVGLTGGAGWERLTSSARISASTGGEEGATDAERLRENRRYYFVGANYTWLVTQLSGEIGWAPGASTDDDLRGTGAFEPGRGSLQGAVTFRVTY